MMGLDDWSPEKRIQQLLDIRNKTARILGIDVELVADIDADHGLSHSKDNIDKSPEVCAAEHMINVLKISFVKELSFQLAKASEAYKQIELTIHSLKERGADDFGEEMLDATEALRNIEEDPSNMIKVAEMINTIIKKMPLKDQYSFLKKEPLLENFSELLKEDSNAEVEEVPENEGDSLIIVDKEEVEEAYQESIIRPTPEEEELGYERYPNMVVGDISVSEEELPTQPVNVENITESFRDKINRLLSRVFR